MGNPVRILVVCTANFTRSQIAEDIAQICGGICVYPRMVKIRISLVGEELPRERKAGSLLASFGSNR